MKTRLELDIEALNTAYDRMEDKLKAERKRHIDDLWKRHVVTGTLKQDLADIANGTYE